MRENEDWEARAFWEKVLYKSGFVRRSLTFSTQILGSGGRMKPFWPSMRRSLMMPQKGVATTGVPQFSASWADMPQTSSSVGKRRIFEMV